MSLCIDGAAPLSIFLRLWRSYAHAVLNTALERVLVYRRGGVYRIGGRAEDFCGDWTTSV
jgi:hypothetical protein